MDEEVLRNLPAFLKAKVQAKLNIKHNQQNGEGVENKDINYCIPNGFVCRDSFLGLNNEKLQELRDECQLVLQSVGRKAGMGGSAPWTNQEIRGDTACFLNNNQLKTLNCAQLLNLVKNMLQLKKEYLSLEGDVDVSFQLACYEGDGRQYICHTDTSASCPNRIVTAIYYINVDWKASKNGGQLILYPTSPSADAVLASKPDDLHPVKFDPLGDRLIIFDSRIPHEVRPCWASRIAVTVWFSRKNLPRIVASKQQERIFIGIGCYRDSECPYTVENLLQKCSCPQRLSFGICWQVDSENDQEMGLVSKTRKIVQQFGARLREIVIPFQEATGPCKARYLTQQLWNAEEYFLQIDSHMRFDEGWDQTLISWLNICKQKNGDNPKVVLSSYPGNYEGLKESAVIGTQHPIILCADRFGEDHMLRLKGKKIQQVLEEPILGKFWAAGFSFSYGEIISDVPYPHPKVVPCLFNGEEMMMLVRMISKGWTIWAPPKTISWHLWSRSHRPTFWREVEIDVSRCGESSREKVKQLLKGEAVEGLINSENASQIPQILIKLGINYQLQQISREALNGGIEFEDQFLQSTEEKFLQSLISQAQD